MSREYREQQITIGPIETGWLIEHRADGEYYNSEKYAFATWEDVVDFVRNHPADFVKVDTTQAVSID